MPPLWNMLLVLVTSVTAVPLLGLDLPREVAIRADLPDDQSLQHVLRQSWT